MSDLEGELLRRLRDLVAFNTVSSRGNGPLVEYVASVLRPKGWKIRFDGYRSFGAEKVNLVATLSAGNAKSKLTELALVAHADTVPWDPKWRYALCVEERRGRLYGRGTCDMKGFIAAMLVAVSRLRPANLTKPLAIILTADEEVGSLGARRLAEAGLVQPRHAIVGEPTSLRPMRAGKGYGLVEVTVRGRESHSACSKLGVSAILGAARLIGALRKVEAGLVRDRDRFFDPPNTTVNVGAIAGGRAVNMVPGECRLWLEWRPIPRQAAGGMLARVKDLAAEIEAAERGIKVELRCERLDEAFTTPSSDPLVRFAEDATGLKAGAVSYVTDAFAMQKLGASTIIMGPGDIRNAHRTGEYVRRRELVSAVGLLTTAIGHFCR